MVVEALGVVLVVEDWAEAHLRLRERPGARRGDRGHKSVRTSRPRCRTLDR